MRRTTTIGIVIAATAMSFIVPAAAQEPGSSLAIGNTALGAGKVTVTGSVTYGQDAVGPVVVATDATGDAGDAGNRAGLDVKELSMQTLLKAKKVVFNMGIEGLAAPLDGSAPATGFHWPVVVNGEDRTRWLGAGTAGSNFPPKAGDWAGLCHNETDNGGWDCTLSLTGSITASAVRWELPFSRSVPAITNGATIEGAGGAYCGLPCSWPWPSVVVGASAPSDFADPPAIYKVPGEIKIGIAPAGAPESGVSYAGTATFSASNDSSGTFSGTVNAPATPGSYTVWVKTCFGIDGTSCTVGSRDITV